MKPFDIVKLFIGINITIATLPFLSIAVFDINIAIDPNIQILTDLLYILFRALQVAPPIIFGAIILSQSVTEVEQKMNLYGLVMIAQGIIGFLQPFLIRTIRATQVISLVFTVVSLIMFSSMFIAGWILPSHTEELSRHRMKAVAYPIVLMVTNLVLVNILPSADTFENLTDFGVFLNFIYTTVFGIYLFILVTSTQSVFGNDYARQEQYYPDTEPQESL